jgi:hypothetical protein
MTPEPPVTPSAAPSEPSPGPMVVTTATPSPTLPDPTPSPTVVSATSVPIIDLHFHPDPSWGDDLSALFDQLGVRAAGNGASGPDDLALEMADRFPRRIIPFAGGYDVRQLVLTHGEQAWNLQSKEVEQFLVRLEGMLQEGRIAGIGEIHVNNWASNIIGSPQFRYPADSPLMQRLLSLSARYGVPLSVHMDAEPESVAQMERLLSSNRDSIWLWAHTGHYAEPALLRRLLEEHSNLYCELSYRIGLSVSRTAIPMDTNGVLKDDWKELIEAFPDRFVIGTDLSVASPASYAAMIAYWRAILLQLSPAAVAPLAHLNAEQLVPTLP